MKDLSYEIGEVNDIVLNKNGVKVACTYAGIIGKEESEKLVKQFAASGEMLEALKYYKEGIEHFYKCINFAKSHLDGKAIEFMNDSNIKINEALKKASI